MGIQTIYLAKYKLNYKQFLLSLLVLLLSTNFLLAYVGHNYFSEGLLNVQSLGFWIGILNFTLITAIVMLYKRKLDLKWSDIGLATPKNWWKPVVVMVVTYGAVMLFSMYIRPYILELGSPPNIEHLLGIRQNLSKLIFTLVVVWITAAFLEELIFRAFFINVLEDLFGKTKMALAFAVIFSSVIFGLLHAYQGVTGILMTGSLSLIFGTAYVFNGKRIWPLVIIHGAIDTVGLISIYNLPL